LICWPVLTMRPGGVPRAGFQTRACRGQRVRHKHTDTLLTAFHKGDERPAGMQIERREAAGASMLKERGVSHSQVLYRCHC
jgi:hypothetical protein